MGATKQMLLEQQEKEAQEIVAECQGCGTGVTSAELNEMPYDEGEPVYIYCSECRKEENWAK